MPLLSDDVHVQGWENFKREFRQLRKSFRYNEFRQLKSNTSNPLSKVRPEITGLTQVPFSPACILQKLAIGVSFYHLELFKSSACDSYWAQLSYCSHPIHQCIKRLTRPSGLREGGGGGGGGGEQDLSSHISPGTPLQMFPAAAFLKCSPMKNFGGSSMFQSETKHGRLKLCIIDIACGLDSVLSFVAGLLSNPEQHDLEDQDKS